MATTETEIKPLRGVLKLRSRGEFVILLQEILRSMGYIQVPLTGYFDRITEDAVFDYQGKNNLKRDGIVGSKTWLVMSAFVRKKQIKKVNVKPQKKVSVLNRGKKGDIVLLLQENLVKLGYDMLIDGDFGPATEKVVKKFQRDSGLRGDGVVGANTWLAIENQLAGVKSVKPKERETKSKLLSEQDLEDFAKRYGLETAAVKAVHEIESSGRGFKGNKIKILFEGHQFWRELKKVGISPASKRAGNENVLYPKWIRTYYRQDQHARLDKAKRIHEEAALNSASYGLFQVMGYHGKTLGFKSAKEFVAFMDANEANQLEVFGRFIKKNNLIKYLKAKNWASFARRYNGPGYKKNKYDTKMANAYRKYLRMG